MYVVFFPPQLHPSTWPNLGVYLCDLKTRLVRSAPGPAYDLVSLSLRAQPPAGFCFCSAGPGALVLNTRVRLT